MGASPKSCSHWSLAALIAVSSVTGIFAATFEVSSAADDSQLSAQARQAFQALPKDMATPEFPDHAGAR